MKNFWLSPNTEKDDVCLAKKVLGQHLMGRRDSRILRQLEKELTGILGVDSNQVFLFNSGRSAFYTLLKALEIGSKDEVAIQAYTCNAAVNPILWVGAKTIYVDIDKSWNLDPLLLERVVKKGKLKAVVVQHTFGVPAQLEKIKNICQKNRLFLIEDCTHGLGGKYRGKNLGLWGDFAYFSFGRDKVISSVYGGALLVNNKKFVRKTRKEYKKTPCPPWRWTAQQLLHPILMEKVIIPLYSFCSIGKIILYFSLKFHLLSKAVISLEKQGKKPACFPQKLPPALGQLVFKQLRKMARLNAHRRRLANFYNQSLSKKGMIFQKLPPASLPVYLRFGMMVEKAGKIQERLSKKGVFLDRWLDQPVGPEETDLKKMGYQWGSCPSAEILAQKEIHFPTSIKVGMKEAKQLVKLFLETKDEEEISG